MTQRPRELTPHAGPRHFVGAELRARRLARNMSLAELSREVHVNASHLARLERAERPIPPDLLTHCDDALAADGALTRLGALLRNDDEHAVTAAGDHVASQAADVASTPDHVALARAHEAPLEADEDVVIPVRATNGRIVYVPLPRRRFLKGLGVAATIATGATGTSLAQDLPPVEHFRQLRSTLADSDNLFGPHRVMDTVREQINLLQEIRKAQRGTDLREIIKVQTEFADLLGWLHQDSGEHHAAQFWLDRALEWSHLSGDVNSTAFILGRKSQLASDMGDGSEAAEMAEASIRLVPPNSRMAAISSVHAVRGYALLGDRDGVTRTHERTQALLDTYEPDQLPWGQFFGRSYVYVHHAESQRLLGNYTTATKEYQSAIDHMPSGFRRDQGVYLAREALAFAGGGDAEQAAHVGMRALAIGLDTGSGRILTELGQVREALIPNTAPDVQQFTDALLDARRQQT